METKQHNETMDSAANPEFIREYIAMPFSVDIECHAPSLLHLEGPYFLAVWFCGRHERSADTAIFLARRDQNGWNTPEMLVKIGYRPHWNPVLFKRPDGTILLFFKVGENISDWETYVMEGTPDGKRWGEPRVLVPGDMSGGRGPVKNKPIILSNGTILAPASSEQGLWRSFADLSADNGKTWHRSAFVPVPSLRLAQDDKYGNNMLGVIQPTVWESSPGNVHMLMRSNNGFIYRTDSMDYGQTWNEISPTELPNNNSGIDLAKLRDGRLLLAYNPVNGNWGNRWEICCAISSDEGRTWNKVRTLDRVDCDQRNGRKSEFSYPAVISCDDQAAIIYTTHRQGFTFWRLSI